MRLAALPPRSPPPACPADRPACPAGLPRLPRRPAGLPRLPRPPRHHRAANRDIPPFRGAPSGWLRSQAVRLALAGRYMAGQRGGLPLCGVL